MFGKVYASCFTGSLRGQPDALLVWFNIIANAPFGICDRTQETIADETGIPLDRVRIAIELLESPDPRSRSKKNDGRRIARLDTHRDWGWTLVNFDYYRTLASESDRRQKQTEKKRRYRQRLRERICPPKKVDNGWTPGGLAASGTASVQKGESEGKTNRFKEPTMDEVKLLFAKAGGTDQQATDFWLFYDKKGWLVGKTRMQRLGSAVAHWISRNREQPLFNKRIDPPQNCI